MEKFTVFESLKKFMNQIKELSNNDCIIVNYCSLLNKITADKEFAIDKQCSSLCEFLKENKDVLTTVPLALNTYSLNWLPLKSSSNTFVVNLMPAFSAATVDQATVLHCHLLKMASLVYVDDPQYVSLLNNLEKTILVEKVDKERDIVDKLFGLVKEIDVNNFDRDEPEKFVESVMTTKLGSILPLLKQPNIQWKVLFKYMFEVVDQMGKERGISDPDVDQLLTSLKDSDYDVTSVAPKIFDIVRKLRLKIPSSFSKAVEDVEKHTLSN